MLLPPLVAACINDDVKMVKHLVSKGADLNKQAPYLGSSLHVAAQYGCLSVMKYQSEIIDEAFHKIREIIIEMSLLVKN